MIAGQGEFLLDGFAALESFTIRGPPPRHTRRFPRQGLRAVRGLSGPLILGCRFPQTDAAKMPVEPELATRSARPLFPSHFVTSFPRSLVPRSPSYTLRMPGRHGCLGCLGGCLIKVLLGAVALLAAWWLLWVALFPWALHIGGRSTPLLYWHGTGTVVSKDGKTYPLYLTFFPGQAVRVQRRGLARRQAMERQYRGQRLAVHRAGYRGVHDDQRDDVWRLHQ